MTTLWRKVHDLYYTGEIDWNVGEPMGSHGGRKCMCIGGAIAHVLTGNALLMYHPYRQIEAALNLFANHVEAPTPRGVFVTIAERVYKWNDRLPYSDGLETVLHALEELDRIALTECQHKLHHGVCIFCNREVI